MQKPNVVGVTKVDTLTSLTAIPTVFIIVLIPGLVSFSEVCKKKKKLLGYQSLESGKSGIG